jgi:methyl-accepting chemotaxis protein
VVANEVRQLATRTNEISGDLRQRIDKVTTGLDASFALLKEISTIDMSEQNVFANERINIIVESLVNQHARFAEALTGTSEMTGKFTDDIYAAVVKMQFQDRAAQEIQNVCAVLDVIGSSDQDADAMIGTLEKVITLGDVKKRIMARVLGHPLPDASSPDTASPETDIDLF